MEAEQKFGRGGEHWFGGGVGRATGWQELSFSATQQYN